MFISVLDLFKIGIGPSSSHTMGPMVAAANFRNQVENYLNARKLEQNFHLRCVLRGSLAFTGKGHATDRAVTLGLNGYMPAALASVDVNTLAGELWRNRQITLDSEIRLDFFPPEDIIFDRGPPLPEHPNGMVFELYTDIEAPVLTETYFSIGGGFINTRAEISKLEAPLKMEPATACPYPFDSAESMLQMCKTSMLSVASMKRMNEQAYISEKELDDGLDAIWQAMKSCIENGLQAEGVLPGGINVSRRARSLHTQLMNNPETANLNDWLCAYAMAVNEENASGHMVVTAPTNGAAGVIPAVLYYLYKHENTSSEEIRDYLLSAGAIGGLIKHRSSISGAEVGCQGEVGSAAAMAAAAMCSIRGGSAQQVENAAEIALEHHLGMTCDPVAGLVQVPCIERNGFGAIKAVTAASLALRGTGQHFMPLDSCIAAMKQTGLEMSEKYKETALGGLAVSITEC